MNPNIELKLDSDAILSMSGNHAIPLRIQELALMAFNSTYLHNGPSLNSTRQAALLAALQAIVNECMDYPPVPRYYHDSYLPPHLLAAAQAAIEPAALDLTPDTA